jgi:hypothetical protein
MFGCGCHTDQAEEKAGTQVLLEQFDLEEIQEDVVWSWTSLCGRVVLIQKMKHALLDSRGTL